MQSIAPFIKGFALITTEERLETIRRPHKTEETDADTEKRREERFNYMPSRFD